MIRYKKMLAAYIGGHFIVDFACAFLFFRVIYSSDNWLMCLLLYNFCAFALQMPIGLLADWWNKNALCAIGGCLFVIVAYMTIPYVTLTAIIAGIGNAMFHIGGGIDVLNVSKDKPTLLGLFISPGALGIYLGTLLGKGEVIHIWVPMLLLLIAAVAIGGAAYKDMGGLRSYNSKVSFPEGDLSGLLIALGCLFGVVLLRSYMGLELHFPWKGIRVWSILLISAVVLGKMSGGFLASLIGSKKTAYLSLGLAALCYLLFDIPAFGIMAVLLFNMTMPITLWAVAKILPGCKGFSFGLLTFALFIGFIPVYLDMPSVITNRFSNALIAIFSLILLIFGLRKAVTSKSNG